MNITPPVGHYVDYKKLEIVKNDHTIRYTLIELWEHSQNLTGPYKLENRLPRRTK